MADVSVACPSLVFWSALPFSVTERETHYGIFILKKTNKKWHMCGVYNVLATHSLRENLYNIVFFAGFEEIPV